MQDKREIGYCVDRLEKTQYFKRVINTIIERVKNSTISKRGSHNKFAHSEFKVELKNLSIEEAKRRTKKRSSYKERKVNALALGADEGRG